MLYHVTSVFIFISFIHGQTIEISSQTEATTGISQDDLETTVPQEIGNLENGTFLNLRGLNLSTVEDTVWQKYDNLHVIDASDNPIESVGILNSKTIQIINLSNGNLRWIPNGSFRGLLNISTIILNNNLHLTTLEVTSKSLINLEATHCSLSEVSFPHAESLKYLNLSHNRVTKIEDGAFAYNLDLEILVLSNNDIDSISDYVFIRLAKLKYLDLSTNKISRTEWTMTLKNINNLIIDHNEIDSIELLMLRNAKYLNISSNKLHDLPEEVSRLLPKLGELDASLNPIRQIKRIKSNSLTKLLLNECKIRAISGNAFIESPNLRFLDVSDNKLDNFSFLSSLHNASQAILNDNPWNCVCNVTVRVEVLCQPDNLALSDFCAISRNEPQDQWFLEAANPVIWAPLVVALVIVVVGCIGCRYCKQMMRDRKDEPNGVTMDLVQNIPEDLLQKLLKNDVSDHQKHKGDCV